MPMYRESDYPDPPPRWFDRLLTAFWWTMAVVSAAAVALAGGESEAKESDDADADSDD